jgi:hypothetical protein
LDAGKAMKMMFGNSLWMVYELSLSLTPLHFNVWERRTAFLYMNVWAHSRSEAVRLATTSLAELFRRLRPGRLQLEASPGK